MLLAIDSGNTNIVFAIFSNSGELLGEWRAGTEANRTADEFGIWLTQLLDQCGLEKTNIEASIIASVVPDSLIHLKNLCQVYFGTSAMVIGEQGVDLDIQILVENPREVGADRLCNAIAAHKIYGGALLILDFGTATTFDVVDEAGNYRGGAIYPGINLSLEALHRGAAQLPRVAIESPDLIIGIDTVSAMQSGIFWGHVSMIEGMIGRISDEFGKPMEVIATGGMAEMFSSACKLIDHVDYELTLKGLFSVYTHNN